MIIINLEKEWISFVKQNNFWEKDEKILLALSGGVDSITLMHLLINLPKNIRPRISIVHINHQLRAESDIEEDYIIKLSKKLDIPLYTHTWEKKIQPKTNIESAARKMRYNFFEEVMKDQEINNLLTAHHLGDQAETILMKITRGGLIENKVGINLVSSFRGKKLIRPLLPFSKGDLYKYAKEHHLTYFEDETNHTDMYFRNRIRRNVLPLLKKENPQVEQHLSEFSKELSDLIDFAGPFINDKTVQHFKNKVLDLDSFLEEEPYIQRLVLKEVFKEIFSKQKSFNKNYVGIFMEWLEGSPPNSSLQLAENISAQKEYNKITFINEEKHFIDSEESYLKKGEWLKLTDGNLIGLFDKGNVKIQDKDLVFPVYLSQLTLPIRIRHRKNGDRMTLKGSGGTKKIKDIFIDQKIPKEERDQAWVLEDVEGTIIWLVGYKESQLFNSSITDKMTSVFIFRSKGK